MRPSERFALAHAIGEAVLVLSETSPPNARVEVTRWEGRGTSFHLSAFAGGRNFATGRLITDTEALTGNVSAAYRYTHVAHEMAGEVSGYVARAQREGNGA